MDINQLIRRKDILELKNIDISNKEWLYMQGEETRNSVAIEGIFSSEEELEDVIENNMDKINIRLEILNYFRTAQSFYDYALSLREFGYTPQYLPIISSLNKQLYKNMRTHFEPGKFRIGEILITGAKIKPPFDTNLWMAMEELGDYL